MALISLPSGGRGTRAVVSVAVALALAAPPAMAAGANPFTLDYSNAGDVLAYARPTGIVIFGRNFSDPAMVDRVQSGGGEVLLYVDVVDGFWQHGGGAVGDQLALYGGPHNDPAYLWSPGRSNWPDTPLMDLRPGSAWIQHAVAHIAEWFPTTGAAGLLLDVVGERLWSPAWSSMSQAERDRWSAGSRDFVHRLRAALGPSAILVANNSWPGGNPDLNGIMVEHHPFSEAAGWAPMLARTDWARPVRNMVIATSAADARLWAAQPGVTHVTDQATYGSPVAPVVSFGALAGPAGTTVPAVDPAPPATPAPSQPAPEPGGGLAPAPAPVQAPVPGGAEPAPVPAASVGPRRPLPFFAPQ